MPRLEAAGSASIHYDIEGGGPLVLLVHGGTGTGAYDWELLRDPMARSCEVVTPDLRGHGRSSDPEWLLSLDQIADDIVQLIEVLGRRPAAIVGFSIGATAILRLLCARPDLTTTFVAIGASPAGHPERVPEILASGWPRELQALRHEHGSGDGHWRELRRRLAESWGGDLDLSAEDLQSVELPTLVVAGDRDPIEPPETALWLARTLPRGELLVVPRAGHFVPRERPRELLAAVLGFLERHAA